LGNKNVPKDLYTPLGSLVHGFLVLVVGISTTMTLGSFIQPEMMPPVVGPILITPEHLLMIRRMTPVRIGDLVTVKHEHVGVIIKIIDDARYNDGQLHLKVHVFEYNNSAWFNVSSLTVLSSLP
jgi:hypothetical protein